MIEGYVHLSILGRAEKKNLVSYHCINPRDFTNDPHKSVDDIPYGGGPGMVMKVEPLFRAVESIKEKEGEVYTILLSAKGKEFTQNDALRLAKKKNIAFICGRYQGVDERVADYVADEEISIGKYVLTGGELPALIICDALVRLTSGVLGNSESLKGESYGESCESSHPLYTRPEIFHDWKVPEVLLGGNHAHIEKWKRENSVPIEKDEKK